MYAESPLLESHSDAESDHPERRSDVKKQFTEAQIIGFLKEAEADLPVKQLCHRHGFSEASKYVWRSKCGGLSVSDARRSLNLG